MSLATIDKDNCSFQPGWDQLTKKEAVKVREEIMAALGLTSRDGFYKRLRGEFEPKVSEAVAIEKVFEKYGITNIWGKYEPASKTV